MSPSANSSEVSSQSTLPSFRAMKPSRLAAMWIVTREAAFAIVLPSRHASMPPDNTAQQRRPPLLHCLVRPCTHSAVVACTAQSIQDDTRHPRCGQSARLTELAQPIKTALDTG